MRHGHPQKAADEDLKLGHIQETEVVGGRLGARAPQQLPAQLPVLLRLLLAHHLAHVAQSQRMRGQGSHQCVVISLSK
jgi:hypothetical protein